MRGLLVMMTMIMEIMEVMEVMGIKVIIKIMANIADGLTMKKNSEGKIVYGRTDALGSVKDVTNDKGKSLMQYRYDAFGNIVSGFSNPYTSAAMYAGKQYDPKAANGNVVTVIPR
ncbi:YD repeat-containing protein [Paenibacillus sp. yr247]|uniref:hypothetical protein n=1 Tax=Paenibacillus sp. yr247 TaxID=1761880 RepID=UPI00088235AF|nr:hypothetical protein [Paenibacillus sp. yr247]SDO04770.1 YD repeat-containing protein [Paenibacillus sp. yr247]